MKHIKFFGILGIAIILSLLTAALSATPVLAAYTYDITATPTEGTIGTTVTVSGTSFDYIHPGWVTIYFAKEDVAEGKLIDLDVKTYQVVADSVDVENDGDEGGFSATFKVPASLKNGAVVLATVTPGIYYIYVTKTAETATSQGVSIKAKVTFTVKPSAALDPLSPATGPVGSQVTISGAYFAASTAITIKYDGAEIPKTPDTPTSASGSFASIITIPESTAGVHNISVTIGSDNRTGQFTVTPSITISPTSGAAGTEVTVSGKGFAPGQDIDIMFDNNPATSNPVKTDGLGSFKAAKFNVPDTVGIGTHFIKASDGTNTSPQQSFDVPTTTTPPTTTPPTTTPTTTPSGTTLSLSQTSGSVGTSLIIAGTGFQPNATVIIKYDDSAIATATVQAGGAFVGTTIFQVPPGKYGAHTITASDGIHTSSITFTVESVAPAAPAMQQPAAGAKVKSPASFSWQAITDESQPVSYALQIGTDKNFTDNTAILIDKKAITTTSYTLTSDEGLKLAGKETPYYWRIKAIDAAQNESSWTAAGEFFVTPPFKFMESPYFYATLGVGALLLFLIGLLLGRKTAFYY